MSFDSNPFLKINCISQESIKTCPNQSNKRKLCQYKLKHQNSFIHFLLWFLAQSEIASFGLSELFFFVSSDFFSVQKVNKKNNRERIMKTGILLESW